MASHSDDRPVPGSERWHALKQASDEQAAAGKRICVKLLVRNRRGEILVVEPSYKSDWDLPGGMAELNEPPTVTGIREFREELGVVVSLSDDAQPLLIDHDPPRAPCSDQLIFLFPVTLTAEEENGLYLASKELTQFRWVDSATAVELLRSDIADRLTRALAVPAGRTRFTELDL